MDTKLKVPALNGTVTKAWLPADKEKSALAFTKEGENNLIITVPAKAPDKINTVIVLEIQDKL
jgi:hypothetical protein